MSDTLGAITVYIFTILLGGLILVGGGTVLKILITGSPLSIPVVIVLGIIGGVIGAGVAWGIFNA